MTHIYRRAQGLLRSQKKDREGVDDKGLESEIKDRLPHDGTGPQRQRDVKSLNYRRNSISEGEKVGKKTGLCL